MKKPDRKIYVPPHMRIKEENGPKEPSASNESAQLVDPTNKTNLQTNSGDRTKNWRLPPFRGNTPFDRQLFQNYHKKSPSKIWFSNSIDKNTSEISNNSQNRTKLDPSTSYSIFSSPVQFTGERNFCINDQIDDEFQKDDLNHVLEVQKYSALTKNLKVCQTIHASDCKLENVFPIDAYHALAVFRNSNQAEKALKVEFREFKLCRLKEASDSTVTFVKSRAQELRLMMENQSSDASTNESINSLIFQNVILRTIGKRVPVETTRKLRDAISEMKAVKEQNAELKQLQSQLDEFSMESPKSDKGEEWWT